MSIFRSGLTVAFFTLLSRIAGLARELCLAYLFGSSPQADCVNVALKFPNLFRRIFAEGALASVFVPIYSKKMLASNANANQFASQILSLLLLILIIITVVMQIFMPQIMLLLAPGFSASSGKFDLAVMLCRITTPYLIFISVCALMGGMLNSVGRFTPFAATPIILNIVIIAGCLIQSNYVSKPLIISIAIMLAGVLQLAFIYYYMRQSGIEILLTSTFISSDNLHLIKQMGPAILNAGMMQISLFVSLSIASFIEGAISILSYAERIYQFPLSLIGTAFATVLLPEMSRLYSAKDLEKADLTQQNALKFALYICVPCSVGIWVLSDFIIYGIYMRGAFTANDCIVTADCLSAFSFGLSAFILNKIFTPIFYANDDQKTPLKITIYSLIINIVLNIILAKLFGAVGIAIGSSAAAWIGVYMLYASVKQRYGFTISKQNWYFILKILISAAIMAVIILLAKSFFIQYYTNKTSQQILQLLCLVSVGVITYLSASFALGLISVTQIWQLIKTR